MGDLNWSNYLELNRIINDKKINSDPLSPIMLVQWINYGYIFKYKINDDFIILYTKEQINGGKEVEWTVFTIYYNDSSNIEEIKKIIQEDLFTLNGKNKIYFSHINNKIINDFKLEEEDIKTVPYISNFIYETEKLKTFSGKKLQKKRNHLNYFIKNNNNIEVKNLKDVNLNSVKNFIKNHNDKYTEEDRDIEIELYNNYFEMFKVDNNYIGTIILIDNKIVAFTFSYINNETLEIVIEKAEKDIRGLYQYLIKTNLEFHNINTKYVERGDDGGIQLLKKSKLSYYPIIFLERFSLTVTKDFI